MSEQGKCARRLKKMTHGAGSSFFRLFSLCITLIQRNVQQGNLLLPGDAILLDLLHSCLCCREM
jgi:hypothetical protein